MSWSKKEIPTKQFCNTINGRVNGGEYDYFLRFTIKQPFSNDLFSKRNKPSHLQKAVWSEMVLRYEKKFRGGYI